MSSFTDSLKPGVGFNPRAYLEKFGYAQGKGLGKNEDGMKTHIAVQKKDDAKGVRTHTQGDAHTAREGGRPRVRRMGLCDGPAVGG